MKRRSTDEYRMYGHPKRGRGDGHLQENSDPTKPQGIPGSLRCLIPEKSTKLIIGSGGQNVKRIGGETGTFVNISSQPFATTDMCTDHIVSITPRTRNMDGTFTNALEQCTAAMKQVMGLAFPQQDPTMDYKCIFLVDASLAGLMIGKGGERIASLRRDFGVQVQLQKPPEGQFDEEVTFSGTLDSVESAVNQLNDAFRIYYTDQPIEEQEREQIAAAKGKLSKPTDRQHSYDPYAGKGGRPGGKGDPNGWYGAPSAGGWSDPGKGGGYGGSYGAGAYRGARDYEGASAISSCPNIPVDRQQLRQAMVYLPSGMDPASFIGKGGAFMKDLKAKCCISGVGYIKRMHLEKDEELSGKNGREENRMDFQATEGIFPYAVSQIFERFRQVEENMKYYGNTYESREAKEALHHDR